MKLFYSVLLMLLVFSSFSCKNDKWITVKLNDYNCSFELPYSSYKQNDRTFLIEGIGKVDCHEVTINTEKTSDPNDGYEFNCFEYPEFNFYTDESIIDIFYKGTIENILMGYNAIGITEEIIDYNGNPGREMYFTISNGKVYGFWRSYIIENKQYSLTVFTNSENLFNESTSKFLNSFKLIDEKSYR